MISCQQAGCGRIHSIIQHKNKEKCRKQNPKCKGTGFLYKYQLTYTSYQFNCVCLGLSIQKKLKQFRILKRLFKFEFSLVRLGKLHMYMKYIKLIINVISDPPELMIHRAI